jgi:hypothetical protein
MASEDIPAMLHYISKTTGQSKVGYAGHSEGTTQMFAAGSSGSQDDYLTSALNMISLFVALAPAAYVSNAQSKVFVALANTQLPENLYNAGTLPCNCPLMIHD